MAKKKDPFSLFESVEELKKSSKMIVNKFSANNLPLLKLYGSFKNQYYVNFTEFNELTELENMFSFAYYALLTLLGDTSSLQDYETYSDPKWNIENDPLSFIRDYNVFSFLYTILYLSTNKFIPYYQLKHTIDSDTFDGTINLYRDYVPEVQIAKNKTYTLCDPEKIRMTTLNGNETKKIKKYYDEPNLFLGKFVSFELGDYLDGINSRSYYINAFLAEASLYMIQDSKWRDGNSAKQIRSLSQVRKELIRLYEEETDILLKLAKPIPENFDKNSYGIEREFNFQATYYSMLAYKIEYIYGAITLQDVLSYYVATLPQSRNNFKDYKKGIINLLNMPSIYGRNFFVIHDIYKDWKAENNLKMIYISKAVMAIVYSIYSSVNENLITLGAKSLMKELVQLHQIQICRSNKKLFSEFYNHPSTAYDERQSNLFYSRFCIEARRTDQIKHFTHTIRALYPEHYEVLRSILEQYSSTDWLDNIIQAFNEPFSRVLDNLFPD